MADELTARVGPQLESAFMQNQWQPPPHPPLPPQNFDRRGRKTGSPWLPAAIFGAAILVATGLVAGALILKDRSGCGTTTCQAWTETRLTLRAIPALPEGLELAYPQHRHLHQDPERAGWNCL